MSVLLSLLLAVTPLAEMEKFFGSTRIEGMVGNGALSVGISRWGEIAVFRFPSPSFWDQIYWLNEADRDAWLFGAKPWHGLWAGVMVDGKKIMLRQQPNFDFPNFQEVEISFRQRYEDEAVLVTEGYFVLDGREIGFRIIDFVVPSTDVFVRRVEVDCSNCFVFHYNNFSPTTIKRPKIPTEDWLADELNDFAVFREGKTLIHFTPFFRTRDEFNEFKKEFFGTFPGYRELKKFAESSTGIFIAVFSPTATHVAVGWWECPFIKTVPQNYILSSTSPAFSNFWNESDFSICETDSVVVSGGNTLTLIVALSTTYRGVLKILEDSRERGFESLRTEVREWWKRVVEKISSSRWFASLPPEEFNFCKRAVISVLQGTDRKTRAMVASISTQPPYAQDWVRDGAYLNLLLDLAGFYDIVTEHNLFYAKVQRKSGELAGSFEMNYYADGMPGGPIPFEIDEVGFGLLTWWWHYLFLRERDAQEALDYLKRVSSSVFLAGDLLVECKSPDGLQCLANEDDKPTRSITLVGALTSLAGLKSARAVALELGFSDLAQKYLDRIRELESAIRSKFNPEFSRPEGDEGFPYLAFPANWRFTPKSAVAWAELVMRDVEEAFALKDLGYADEKLSGMKGTFVSYQGKNLLSLIQVARFLEKNGKVEDAKRILDFTARYLDILIKEVPNELGHMGEVAVFVEGRGWMNQVATPHLWQATLTCLCAIAFANPEFFDFLFPQEEKARVEGKAPACSCSTVRVTDFLVFIPVLFFLKKRATLREED